MNAVQSAITTTPVIATPGRVYWSTYRTRLTTAYASATTRYATAPHHSGASAACTPTDGRVTDGLNR